MVETKDRPPTLSQLDAPRHARIGTAGILSPSRRRQTGRFIWHYFEMCVPMCVGFVVGDLIYLWAAGLFGYSEPFSELPELSVVVVTFNMTAPMAAWMLFRGMPRRATAEMSAAMPFLGILLLALGWVTVVPKDELALLEHGLMMPVMLIAMFFRLDVYTGRAGHGAQKALAAARVGAGHPSENRSHRGKAAGLAG